MGHLRSHPPRVLLALLVLLLCAPTLRAETARATAHPTSGGPALATADVTPTAAGASARARATRERVEVVSERGDAARVFANPEGTFTREQSLRPHGAAAPANRLRAADNQPQWSSGPGGWALVYGLPGDLRGQSYWLGDGDGVAKVGFSSWERPTVLVRSYFQYDVGALAGKQVLRAEFNVFESYAPSCTPQPVQVWQTGVVEPWTTWDTQPPAIRELDTRTVANGYDSRCPVDWVGFDVTAAAQDAAAGNRLVTLMLRAPDEGDRYQWKKFRPDPRLIVTYNSLPEPPSALAVGDRNGDLACGVRPHEPYVRTGTPTLRATVGDPDGGPVAAEFEWWARGERPLGSRGTVMQNSGTSFSVSVPDDVFGDGARIGWRVRGWDGTAHGPWSGWCDVTVDGTAPAAPPIVGSTDYPPDGFGGGIGRTGRFALRTGGDADIVRFRYGLVTPPTREMAAVDGAASVEVTPAVGDPHDLYVVGVDRAGNESPPTAYHFRVRTTRFPPVRHWRLDGHAPETAVPDALGRGSTGTLVPGQTAWDTGRVGDAVWFDGLAGHLSPGPTSTIHTGGSFSVAAWVRLDRLDGSWRTAVSQAGDRASGFHLQYRSDTRQWAFTVPSADVDDFAGDRVSGDAPVRPHVWTHLVGVYDAGEEQIRLYVDGRFASRAPHATRWHAAGPVHIGDARFAGAAVDFWPGAVDDVRLYDRVLTDGRVNPGDRVAPDSDVHTLATKPAEPAGRWTFEENTPDSTADTSGQRRAGTFVGGASWTPVGTGRAVLLDGVDDHVVVAGVPARTDAGFTVGARVRADAARTDMTAVSRSGAGTARSALRYDARRRAWEFVVTADDTDDAPRWTATAPATAVTGRWTHLAGIHDTAAEELRLYVDGVLQAVARAGPSRPIDEGLRIGAHLTRGVPDEFWAGAIDDVRLYRGVRAPDQIADEADDPTEGTVFARDGLHRSLAHDGEHTTTGGAGAAGLAPPGSHLEYELGWYAPEGAAGTRVLYSCLLGDDQFTSVDPRCEGHRLLGALGSIYAEAPGDEPVIDLYRCRTAGGEHYDSVHDDCEGGGTREFRLGRLRAYAPLIRYVQPDAPADHTSTVGGTAPGYRAEGRIGVLSLVQRPGTRLLFACRDGTDTFTSLDSACEGGHGLRTLGWIHSRAAIPGDDRCTRTSYARNRETRLVSAVSRVEVVAVACATPRFPEHAVSDERTHYDGLAWAEPPTAGDATLREKVAAYADGRPRYVPVTRTRHDVHGRVLESVDALDRRTVTAFAPPTGPPQTSTSTNPLGHTTTTTLFRAWAEPQAVVDANGRRTEFVRDPLGRLTEVWMPGSAAGSRRLHERYTYTMRKDGTSHVATATAKADGGLVTEYTLYDGMLRARQTQKPAWGGGRVVTDTFHDPRGLVVRTNSAYNTVGEPDGNLVGADPIAVPAYTTTRFDGAARPVLATTHTREHEWRTTTAYFGDHTDVVPPTGGTTTSTYVDARGRTTELRQYHGTEPRGPFDATGYTYALGGQLATLTDAAGNTLRYGYDLLGRRIEAHDPDKGDSTMRYDDVGQLLTRADARGAVPAYAYDPLGRRTELRADSPAGALLAQWTYDAVPDPVAGTPVKGHRASATRFVGDRAYRSQVTGYDAAYRVASTSLTMPAGTGLPERYETATSYHSDGSVAAQRFPAVADLPAETVLYGYDSLGLSKSVSSSFGDYVADTHYTALSEPDRITHGADGASVWQSTYYESGTRRVARTLVEREAGTTTVDETTYGYDPIGNVGRIRTVAPDGIDVQCLRYDHLRRTKAAWTTGSSRDTGPAGAGAAAAGPAPYRIGFDYDAAGNRHVETRQGPNGAAETVRTYHYPSAGAPQPHTVRSVTTGPGNAGEQSYTYSPTGATTVRPGPNGDAQHVTWDAEDRPAAVTDRTGTTRYVHDADGARLLTDAPTGATLHVPNGEISVDAATGALHGTRYYADGRARTIAVRTGDAVGYQVNDLPGTGTVSVDARTLADTRRRLDPFGQPRGGRQGSLPGARGFVGGTRDPATGLTRLGARDYDPGMGRFTSVDPILDPQDPQSVHGFAYSHDNPAAMHDPSGTICALVDAPGGARCIRTGLTRPPLKVTDLPPQQGSGSKGGVPGSRSRACPWGAGLGDCLSALRTGDPCRLALMSVQCLQKRQAEAGRLAEEAKRKEAERRNAPVTVSFCTACTAALGIASVGVEDCDTHDSTGADGKSVSVKAGLATGFGVGVARQVEVSQGGVEKFSASLGAAVDVSAARFGVGWDVGGTIPILGGSETVGTGVSYGFGTPSLSAGLELGFGWR